MLVTRNVPAGRHYVWSVEGKPISVHLSLQVVDKLQPSRSETARSPEEGGVLVGFVRPSEDGFLIAVEGAVPVSSEHARGESWILSKSDRRHLEAVLGRLQGNGIDRPGVVGWYRTHSRPGLFLDQHDFELFQTYFTAPSNVALLIEAASINPVAGFFFWEEGDIQRIRPYETFPFTAKALAGRSANAAVAPASSEVPVRAPVAPALKKLASGRIASSSIRKPALKKWLMLAPVAAGILMGVFWDPRPLEERQRPAEEPETRARSTPEPRAVYKPPPLPQESSPVYTPPPEDPFAVPVVRRRAAPPKQIRTLIVPDRPRTPVAEPSLDFAAPAITATSRYQGVPPAERRPAQAVATLEPVKPSVLRRVVGSIPGLGFLKRRKAEPDETWTPARAVRQVRPQSPLALPDDVPVRIRLTVTSTGEVDKAELLSRSVEPRLAERALEAAKRWRFEPARLEEKAVASELILQFRFPRST